MEKEKLYTALVLKELYKLKSLGFQYSDFKMEDFKNLINRNSNKTKAKDENGDGDDDGVERLRSLVSKCQLCKLSKSRKNTVFGEGDLNAKIFFIGEAPGATEDITGRPFVGNAGELLTKMIENVLLIPRKSCYIANIVKCRPPGNRVPTPDEALSCRPYLMEQIDIVKPKIVVTLGATAYKYLTENKEPISKVRGSIIKRENYILIPTFHPSYLLRNPSAKRVVYEDLIKIKAISDAF